MITKEKSDNCECWIIHGYGVDGYCIYCHKKALEEQAKEFIKDLEEIGWTGGYLKLLKETLDSIYTRKVEKEQEKVRQEQLIQGGKREEEIFKKKIKEQMEQEQKRLQMKQIEVQKQEDAKARMESQRVKAFKLLDTAEVLLNKGDYNLSIQTYRQAGLILSEIDFPTDVVKVMIHKIQVKKREGDRFKQNELEDKIKQEEENRIFQENMQKLMRAESKKIRLKLYYWGNDNQKFDNYEIELLNKEMYSKGQRDKIIKDCKQVIVLFMDSSNVLKTYKFIYKKFIHNIYALIIYSSFIKFYSKHF